VIWEECLLNIKYIHCRSPSWFCFSAPYYDELWYTTAVVWRWIIHLPTFVWFYFREWLAQRSYYKCSPPNETVGVSMPPGWQKGNTPNGCHEMVNIHHPQSQEAHQINYPSDVTTSKTKVVCLRNISLFPYNRCNLPTAPHYRQAGFMGLVTDCIMFPFSSNTSAPHYPPCVTS
jgi:hypothetical protein